MFLFYCNPTGTKRVLSLVRRPRLCGMVQKKVKKNRNQTLKLECVSCHDTIPCYYEQDDRVKKEKNP